MHRLYEYWQEWPPVHETNYLAHFKPKEKRSEEMDTETAVAVQAVTGTWRGRKPFSIDELEALNREYQRDRK